MKYFWIGCAFLIVECTHSMKLEKETTPPSLRQICASYINIKLTNAYRALLSEVTRSMAISDKDKDSDAPHLALEHLHRLNRIEKKIPHIAHVTPNKITLAQEVPQEVLSVLDLDMPSFLYKHNKIYAAQLNVIMRHLIDNATHKGSYHPIETYHETVQYLLPPSCLSLADRIASHISMWRSKTMEPIYDLKYKNSGNAIHAMRSSHHTTVIAHNPGLHVLHAVPRPTIQTIALPAYFASLLACNKNGTRACYKTFTNDVIGIITMSHNEGKTEASTREITLRSPYTIQAADLSDNGAMLAVGLSHHDQHLIKIINLHNDSEHAILTPQKTSSVLHKLAFSPSNTYLISCHKEGTTYLWKNFPWRCKGSFHLDVLNPSVHNMSSIVFSADESVILMHEENQDDLFSYHPETKSLLHSINHKGGIVSIAIDPSGTFVATGGNDGTLRIWDRLTSSCLKILICPAPNPQAPLHDISPAQNKATALNFIDEGRTLMVGCERGELFCWYIPYNFEREIFSIALEDAIEKKNIKQQRALEESTHYKEMISNKQKNALHTYRILHKQKSAQEPKITGSGSLRPIVS